MELKEGKERFIQTWGTLGSSWGLNRTMAQVQAMLLISPNPMSTQELMEELGISRGNANMSLRTLMDWGLVHKVLIAGERKEFFVAEKDMWEIVRKVIIQRKKKELEPALKVLNDITAVEGNSAEVNEFKKVVEDLNHVATKADSTLDRLIRAEQNWFMGTFINLIK